MTWNLYRILNNQHEQQPIPESVMAGLSFDPDAKKVQGANGPVETTNMLMAHKDGRQIAIARLAAEPELRYCFEAGPALPREDTERARGIKGSLEDVLPDTTNYPATVRDCYEQGDLIFVVFDLDHDDGKGCVVTANRADSDEDVEQQLIKEISDTQTELFEGYVPDEYDM